VHEGRYYLSLATFTWLEGFETAYEGTAEKKIIGQALLPSVANGGKRERLPYKYI
jgi:hypothetical protein